MFKAHYATCLECGEEEGKKLIVVKCGLCDYHNRLKKGKSVLKTFKTSGIKPIKKKRKATGEAAMFREIWEERPQICTNCKVPLGNEPRTFFFAHIVRKSKSESLRLDKNNIRLLCFLCHQAFDQGTKEQFEKRTKQ